MGIVCVKQIFLNMKILLLLTEVFGKDGGIQTYNRCLLKALDELSNEHNLKITAFILNDSDSPKTTFSDNISLHCFKRNKILFSFNSIFKSENYDLIVLGHINFLPMVNLFYGKSKKCLIVYGVEVWRKLTFFERIELNKIHKILSISDFTKRELQKFNKIEDSRFSILPCTIVKPEENRITIDKKPMAGKMILSVSRLIKTDKAKNIDLVIKALPAILKEVPNAFYVVVGDGDDLTRLKNLAKSLNVYEKVVFVGRASPDLLYYYYNSSDVFVLLSELEGFGIVFLEAMYFAKPCIGANIGGVLEVIEHGKTGLFVEPSNINSLVDNIVKLLRDEKLCNLMGKAGRERLEKEFLFESFKTKLKSAFLRDG